MFIKAPCIFLPKRKSSVSLQVSRGGADLLCPTLAKKRRARGSGAHPPMQLKIWSRDGVTQLEAGKRQFGMDNAILSRSPIGNERTIRINF